MTRADIIAVLPSLVSSSKLASLGAVVGTVSQDRATAIAGRLGPAPNLDPGRGDAELAARADPPLLVRRRRRSAVHAAADLPGGGQRHHLVPSGRPAPRPTSSAARPGSPRQGRSPSTTSSSATRAPPTPAAYIAGPLTALYRNATAKFTLEGITPDHRRRGDHAHRGHRAGVGRRRRRSMPGRDVALHVVVRTSTGEERLLHQTVAIPAHATGTLQLVVSDGPRLGLQDLRDARRAELQPVSQIVRVARTGRGAATGSVRPPDGAGRRRGDRRRADARTAGLGRRGHRWRPAVERRHHPAGRAARASGRSPSSTPSPDRASSRSPSSRDRPQPSAASRLWPPPCAVLLLASLLARCRRRDALRRSAVLAGRHPGRLPEGRPRAARRRRARPADPRADHHPRVRRQRALRVDRGARTRRCGVPRHRQRRQGVPRRRQRPGHALLRCAGAAGARGAAAARRVGARRHLARRPGLPRGRARAAATRVLRSRREVHLGAGRRRRRAGLRRDRRSQGPRLPRGRRRHWHSRSTRRPPPTSSRWPSTPIAGWSSAPSRPAGSSGSTPRAGRSCCSTPTCRRRARCGSTAAGGCTWWRRRAAAAAAEAAAATR